ncbi:hypothetical protein PV328_011563 [Microctonus aethiopoides]|uniref:Centrobin n=1 Tax=Microctonus aethiopoides TaxID=144406 RepID=A0AA39EW53_9HYME|nr:hypothetical protein PV328_011563 [Microctonus aethiopoides]
MSESDDTDILLLIPPDLFTVASSQSEESLTHCYHTSNNQIVNELLGHVQLLEDRISAIETRDNSLNPSLIEGTLSEIRIGNDEQNHDLYPDLHLENTGSIISQPLTSCSMKNCVNSQNFTSTKPILNSSSLSKYSNLKDNDITSGLIDFSKDSINENMAFATVNIPTSTMTTGHVNNDAINLSQQLMNFNYNTRDVSNASKAILNDVGKVYTNGNDRIDKNYPISEMNDFLSMQRCDLSPYKHNKNYSLSLSERSKRLDDNIALNITSTPKKHYNLRDGACYKNDRVDNTINSPGSQKNIELKPAKETNETPLNTEYKTWQSQRLISLSDFWLPDGNKSEEEMMRIKLEEEKFRREHCEQLIQELQKRLLEQQEKVAVAIRVDKEKSDIILQFQTIWNKFKERWNALEVDHNKLQSSFEAMKKQYDDEISDLKLKLKEKDEELSKMINLMSECEAKRDAAVKEKISLLESHVIELEKYKSLVQTAENRCETIKNDYDKLCEKNQQLEQVNKNLQQDFQKERLKSGEVRSEMSVIHKALDTCEAELIILRQEKGNLLLKLKEEDNRIGILEKNKILLLEELNNAKKSEDLLREEIKSLTAEQEAKRSELRDIYQNQVDEVVNIKLKEFQSQLDTAELTYQMELDAKQRAIAECAARKIKNIIDKHQLEINLLEEKHKEEKRLYDIRLSQTTKKTMVLETQLNAQQNAKSRLADQLHSLMEKQYHQALQIISTENATASYQRSNADKLIEIHNVPNKSDDFGGISYTEPVKLQTFKSERKQLHYPSGSGQDYDESLVTIVSSDESPSNKLKDSNDLKKYIKMILQMQEPKKHFANGNGIEHNNSNSSVEVCREVPRKFYLKAEAPSDSDVKNFVHDTGEDKNSASNTDLLISHENKYFPIRTISQGEKQKPPWK